MERKVLSENDRLAADLRARFRDNGVFCLNLISSPGSGKTSLLERTLAAFDRVGVSPCSPATSKPIVTPCGSPVSVSPSSKSRQLDAVTSTAA
jgi:hydrogenase nickel incorporation protein HypB